MACLYAGSRKKEAFTLIVSLPQDTNEMLKITPS